MQGTWAVFLNGNKVGTCTAKEEGLYTYFNCSCKVDDSRIFRLYLCTENREFRLGIPQPKGKGLALTARLPSSALSEKVLSFELIPLGEERNSNFVPIVAGKPFPHLDKVESGTLVSRNGQIGIYIQ